MIKFYYKPVITVEEEPTQELAKLVLEEMNEDPNTFVRRIGLVSITNTFANFKGIIYLPILTKTLSISDYGIWTLLIATVGMLNPLILLGLNSAVLRFLSPLPKEKIVQGVITVVLAVLCTGTIVSVLLFFSADYIANTLLKVGSATTIIQMTSLLIILDSVNTILLGSFRVFGMIKKYSLVVFTKTLVEICLILLLVLLGYGLIGALSALIITASIGSVLVLFFIFSYAGFSRPDFSILKPYLLFGIPLIPITLSRYVLEISDRYLIGFFMGAEHVGIYSAAYGIGVIPLGLSTYLVYILGPTVYKLYDTGYIEKTKKYLSYSLKYLLMLSIPSAFGLAIIAKPLLSTLTTEKFVSGGTYIIPLVVVSIVFWGIEQIFGVSLFIFKKRKIFVIAFAVASISNFVLNILLIPRYGIIAAAITTLFSYILLTSIVVYSARKKLKFHVPYIFILKCIIASTVMFAAIGVLNPTYLYEIILSIIFGVAIYFGMLLLQKGFQKGELENIFKVIGLNTVYKRIIAKFAR